MESKSTSAWRKPKVSPLQCTVGMSFSSSDTSSTLRAELCTCCYSHELAIRNRRTQVKYRTGYRLLKLVTSRWLME